MKNFKHNGCRIEIDHCLLVLRPLTESADGKTDYSWLKCPECLSQIISLRELRERIADKQHPELPEVVVMDGEHEERLPMEEFLKRGCSVIKS